MYRYVYMAAPDSY